MPFYVGKSADGSDMREFEGMYVSPSGKYWGNQPISIEDELELNKYFSKSRTKMLRVKNKPQHQNRKTRRGLRFGYKLK